MSSFKRLILLAVGALLLGCTSCSNTTVPEGESFNMVARITEIGQELTVEVISAPHGNEGVFFVIHSEAEYFGQEGERISPSALSVGDKVEICYSGQVMMSYPPKIAARRITQLAEG